MAKLCFPVVLLCLLLTAAAEAEGPAITQAWLDGNQVTVTISGGQENTTILCAAYKHDGRMVYADTRSADGETASFTLNSAAEYDKVRVFAADGDYRPLCPAVEAKEGNFNTLMEIDTGLSDAFGRPVVHGYRGNEDLGEYTKKPDAVYFQDVRVEKLFQDLSAENEIMAEIYVNGVKIAGNAPDLPAAKIENNTSDFLWNALRIKYNEFSGESNHDVIGFAVGNGTEIDLFQNDVNDDITICVINWYGGIVDEIQEETPDHDAYINVRLATDEAKRPVQDMTARYYSTSDFAKNDVVAYTCANGKLQDMYKLQAVQGFISRYVLLRNLTINSQTFSYAQMIAFEGNLNGMELINGSDYYDVYLDRNGYVLWIDDGDAPLMTDEMGYALITRIVGESEGSVNDNEAQLLFADGTRHSALLYQNYTSSFAPGDIALYRKEGNSYRLTKPRNIITDKSGNFRIQDHVIQGDLAEYRADSDTAFVVYSSERCERTTGIENTPSIDSGHAYACIRKDGMIKILFVWDGRVEIDEPEGAEDPAGEDSIAVILAITSESDSDDYGNRARLLLPDGTRRTVQLAEDYTAAGLAVHDIVRYQKLSDNAYQLIPVVNETNISGHIITGTLKDDTADLSYAYDVFEWSRNYDVVIDSSTVFLVYHDGIYRRYLGIENAPVFSGGYTNGGMGGGSVIGEYGLSAYAYVQDSVIKYLYIVGGDKKNTSQKDVTFLIASTASDLIREDDALYVIYTAIVGNRVETVKVKAGDEFAGDGGRADIDWIYAKDDGKGGLRDNGYNTAWNSVIVNAVEKDGADSITRARFSGTDANTHSTRGIKSSSGRDITVGINDDHSGETYTLASNVSVWFIDEDDNVVNISPNGIETDSGLYVFYTLDLDDQEITNLYIIETEN